MFNLRLLMLLFAVLLVVLMTTMTNVVDAHRRFQKGVMLGYILAQNRGGYGGGYGGFNGF